MFVSVHPPSPPSLPPSLSTSMCAHCEEQPAVMFCPACSSSFFCMECDTVLHRAVKLRPHLRRKTLQHTHIEHDDTTGPPSPPSSLLPSTSASASASASSSRDPSPNTRATRTEGGKEGGERAGHNNSGNLAGGHLEIDRHEIRIQAKLGEGYFGVVFRYVPSLPPSLLSSLMRSKY